METPASVSKVLSFSLVTESFFETSQFQKTVNFLIRSEEPILKDGKFFDTFKRTDQNRVTMDSRVGTAARPRTGRPTTSARPLTSTGLVAPKTARGKTGGLRRQVQDKSYWIGIIKAKMNELTTEINATNKESEFLATEQSRISVWQKQAETLARQLGLLTHELSIYNEFSDRLRLGEGVDIVKDDIHGAREENEQLTTRLEKGLEEKKNLESLIKSYEEKLKTAIKNRENVRKNFTPDQKMKFEQLESQNRSLSVKITSYETELEKLRQQKNSIVTLIHSGQSDGGSGSFLRKEILSGFERFKSLEKQRDEMIDQSESSEKVTGKLLGQLKRDNKEISGLELRMAEILAEVRKAREELELYQSDSDVASKYQELKEKSERMDSFLEEFEQNKSEEVDKVTENGKTVNETIECINRIISHIDSLKETESYSQEKGSKGVQTLIDEKRRLELDLSKMVTLEAKIAKELESLKKKNESLQNEIDTFGDISKLKKEMEEKAESLREEKERLAEKSDEIRKSCKELKSKFEVTKSDLSSNDTYRDMKLLEVKLSDLVSTNFRLQAMIEETDNSFLKQRVMEDVKKYNQKIQGY